MAITRTETKWNFETRTHGEPTEVMTYVGRVVKVYSKDHRAMSDVYTTATFATVVEDDGSVAEVLVNANFECDTSNGRAKADADPMALLAYVNHLKAIEDARAAQARQAHAARELKERNAPELGKRMRVVRGRKVTVGTEGTVAYIGENRVLLKAHDAWRDRKADGVWVQPGYLEAL